jgi:hypothetical protein
LQRFISRDELFSSNRYEYAAGSPLNFIDKNGLQPQEPDTPTGGTEFGNSGIFRIAPQGGNPPILHNNGRYKPRPPKPQDNCNKIPWTIDWPEWEPVDYHWTPTPWDLGPIPDFQIPTLPPFPPPPRTRDRKHPDPIWKQRRRRLDNLRMEPEPPIHDPIGEAVKAWHDYQENVDLNDADTTGISDYNRRIREAQARDPRNWRDTWIRENGGPPIIPTTRRPARVDL